MVELYLSPDPDCCSFLLGINALVNRSRYFVVLSLFLLLSALSMIFQCPSLALSSLIRSPVSERDCKDTHFFFTSKFFRDFFLTFFIPAPRPRAPTGPQHAGFPQLARNHGGQGPPEKIFQIFTCSANFSRCGHFFTGYSFSEVISYLCCPVIQRFSQRKCHLWTGKQSLYLHIMKRRISRT